MIGPLEGWKDEYLGEEKATGWSFKDAPRLPSAFATERLLTNNRGDFSLGGHRLSSLYRKTESGDLPLTRGYFSAFSSLKYSNSTIQGVTTPGVAT